MRPASDAEVAPSVKWLQEAEQSKASPGQWFAITERESEYGAHCFAHQIVTGRKAAFRPRGHYEARSRGLTVYVKFVGSNPAESGK